VASVAVPTWDSVDILYENNKYGLPLDPSAGIRLYWFSSGARSTSYSSIEFYGFPTLMQDINQQRTSCVIKELFPS